jgi:hypothetical protein
MLRTCPVVLQKEKRRFIRDGQQRSLAFLRSYLIGTYKMIFPDNMVAVFWKTTKTASRIDNGSVMIHNTENGLPSGTMQHDEDLRDNFHSPTYQPGSPRLLSVTSLLNKSPMSNWRTNFEFFDWPVFTEVSNHACRRSEIRNCA